MGNFGSYENALQTLKNKECVLKSQVYESYLTPVTVGIIVGIDLCIKYIEELLVDEIRISEQGAISESQREAEEAQSERL